MCYLNCVLIFLLSYIFKISSYKYIQIYIIYKVIHFLFHFFLADFLNVKFNSTVLPSNSFCKDPGAECGLSLYPFLLRELFSRGTWQVCFSRETYSMVALIFHPGNSFVFQSLSLKYMHVILPLMFSRPKMELKGFFRRFIIMSLFCFLQPKK